MFKSDAAFRSERGVLAHSTGFGGLLLRAHVRFVEALAQFFARTEDGNELFVDGDGFARARITPDPSIPPLHRKGSEPAQFHALFFSQSFGYRSENRIEDILDIALVKMRIAFDQLEHQFRFNHEWSIPSD